MTEAIPSRMTSSRNIAHSALYNLVGFAANALYIIILVPVVLNALGTELFGLWSLVTALTGYFGLADLGLTISFVKYLAEFMAQGDERNVNKVIQHGVLFYACFSLVILASAHGAFAWLFGILRLPPAEYDLVLYVLLVSLVGFGVTSSASTLYGVLSSLQRTDVSNILVIVSQVVRLLAIVAALSLGGGLRGMVSADLAVTVATVAALFILTKKYYPALSLRPAGFDRPLMKKLIGFGSQLQMSRFAEVVQGHFDKLLLARFVGLSAVTLYDFGSRPLGRARAFPLSALVSLIPAVSALDVEQNSARIRSALLRGARYLLFVSVPLFGFLFFFAEPVITVWLGAGFEQAAMTMKILSVAYFCSVMAGMPSLVAQGLGEPRYQMYAMLFQSILNIVLSSVLVHMFGYYGAVAGTTIAGIAGAVLFIQWYGRRLIDAPLRTFVRLGMRPAGAMLAATAAGLAVDAACQQLFHASTQTGQFMVLIATGMVFVIVYGVLLVGFRCFDDDDKRLAKSIVPARFSGWMKV
jgi:O-antigen/teichoic acid export membrane protein